MPQFQACSVCAPFCHHCCLWWLVTISRRRSLRSQVSLSRNEGRSRQGSPPSTPLGDGHSRSGSGFISPKRRQALMDLDRLAGVEPPSPAPAAGQQSPNWAKTSPLRQGQQTPPRGAGTPPMGMGGPKRLQSLLNKASVAGPPDVPCMSHAAAQKRREVRLTLPADPQRTLPADVFQSDLFSNRTPALSDSSFACGARISSPTNCSRVSRCRPTHAVLPHIALPILFCVPAQVLAELARLNALAESPGGLSPRAQQRRLVVERELQQGAEEGALLGELARLSSQAEEAPLGLTPSGLQRRQALLDSLQHTGHHNQLVAELAKLSEDAKRAGGLTPRGQRRKEALLDALRRSAAQGEMLGELAELSAEGEKAGGLTPRGRRRMQALLEGLQQAGGSGGGVWGGGGTGSRAHGEGSGLGRGTPRGGRREVRSQLPPLVSVLDVLSYCLLLCFRVTLSHRAPPTPTPVTSTPTSRLSLALPLSLHSRPRSSRTLQHTLAPASESTPPSSPAASASRLVRGATTHNGRSV